MGEKPDIIAKTGLQFFGRIAASISHEMKNVLAIVNENAGLLEDLTFMAERGQPTDPARLMKMAQAVKKQIGRGDDILKNMNLFAHTIDATVAEVDLQEIIDLFLALTERLTTTRGFALDLKLPPGQLTIPTAPFFLMNLLWSILEFFMSAGGREKRLELVIAETENSVKIQLRQPAGFNRHLLESFPSDSEKAMLGVLAADLKVEPKAGEIVLRLPKKME